MATLLIQSGDNEANVFFISMSGVQCGAKRGKGISPLSPSSGGRQLGERVHECRLTSRGMDTGRKGVGPGATKLSTHHSSHVGRTVPAGMAAFPAHT